MLNSIRALQVLGCIIMVGQTSWSSWGCKCDPHTSVLSACEP